MTLLNIIGLALAVGTLLIDLITDHRLRLQKRPVNHLRGALLRLIGLVPASILLPFPAIGVLFFGYYVLFEGLNNLMNGQKWGYVGETAALDKFTRAHPWFAWVRYVGLLISIAILFI